MKRYISDIHFFHRNVNDVDGRGFETMFDMHETIVRNWNSAVDEEDEIYILGDLSFGKGVETWELLNKLKGKLILIEGNHDFHYLDDREFVDSIFDEIVYYSEVENSGRKVILSHYPMPMYNKQFSTDKNGSANTFMLYGHVHNTYDEYLINRFINDVAKHPRLHSNGLLNANPMNMINTCCVFSNYQPLTLDEWITVDTRRRRLMNEWERADDGYTDPDSWQRLNDVVITNAQNNWR